MSGLKATKNQRTGSGDHERRRLRVAEGDPLRDELADDDVQVRDQEERDRERDDRGGDRVEDVREDRLAQGTDGQARGGHAELHRGDEPRRVRGDLEDETGAAVALVAQLGDPRAARRDEAVLGRHEKRVQQQETCDREKLKKEGHAPLSGARVLGGWSSSNGGL